ncbi:hypothetical protein HYE67_005089 [Fusarium culmorum]|uniref:Uncharacterized protein n=1 Tax=Fusarium culmorum TaxID=5516 RepID=A0A7S8HVK3_FUSCU|nr:hypothetical protein HYE67_005089 [Fusarium culmorum]
MDNPNAVEWTCGQEMGKPAPEDRCRFQYKARTIKCSKCGTRRGKDAHGINDKDIIIGVCLSVNEKGKEKRYWFQQKE